MYANKMKIVRKGDGIPVSGMPPVSGHSSGKLLFATKDFSIVMGENEPGTELPMHKHGIEQVVIYMPVGKGEQLMEDGTVIPVGPGDIWHEGPGDVHRFKNTGSEKAVQLQFFFPPRKQHLEAVGL